jgi:outer membrane protein assembly factor BamB/serine/threonine protein kinase
MGDRKGQYIDDYRLIRRLGAGNFGEVYLGEHAHDQSQVAVKLLKPLEEDWKAFVREASTVHRLKHPHIVQLLFFGISTDDIPYLIMDFAPNGTLRDRHPKGSQLPLDTVLSYLQPLASALQYAHDRRVVHRDVKPENVLVGRDGEVLLSDFGIAIVAPVERSLSTQNMGGTAPYMAPEQIRGKPQPASDQYALGIMTYEWLCGVRPFQGNQWEILEQHRSSPPPSLCAKCPDISPEVEEIVLKTLAKDPQGRFARIEDFTEALARTLPEKRLTLPLPSLLPAENPPSQPEVIQKSVSLPPTPPAPQNVVTRSLVQEGPVEADPASFVKYSLKTDLPPVLFTMPIAHPPPESQEIPFSPTNLPTLPPAPIARRRVATGKVLFFLGLLLLIVGGSTFLGTTLFFGRGRTTTLTPRSFQTGGAIVSSPAVANGTVYVGSYDGSLYALDAQTGRKLWSFLTGSHIYSSPAVANGVVYVGSDDYSLYALDAKTGSKLWSFQTGDHIHSSPAVANAVVYVGSDDYSLYALDAKTGRMLWSFQTGWHIKSSPAVANGVVYFGSYDYSLYALDAKTGSNLWSFQTGGSIYSSPAVVNGVVYVGSSDHSLYALDAQTGRKLWSFQTGNLIESSPAVANGVVYVGSDDDSLYALDAKTGRKL